jgi:hypothetical protein
MWILQEANEEASKVAFFWEEEIAKSGELGLGLVLLRRRL